MFTENVIETKSMLVIFQGLIQEIMLSNLSRTKVRKYKWFEIFIVK